jgi:hypothetical protein
MRCITKELRDRPNDLFDPVSQQLERYRSSLLALIVPLGYRDTVGGYLTVAGRNDGHVDLTKVVVFPL